MTVPNGKVDHGLGDRLHALIGDNRACHDLARYFGAEGGAVYTGAWFERLAGGGDRPETQDAIEADDIVAVSLLSVDIGYPVTRKLLVDRRADIARLLASIPTAVPLWDAGDDVVGPGSPADQLWQLLRGLDDGEDTGRRWVTAGKLLARKRPHLIPVYDSQVKAQVGLNSDASWWLSLRAALQHHALRDRLVDTHHQARVPAAVGLLRTLDVILWMRAIQPRSEA
jgi:hypothetical protein